MVAGDLQWRTRRGRTGCSSLEAETRRLRGVVAQKNGVLTTESEAIENLSGQQKND